MGRTPWSAADALVGLSWLSTGLNPRAKCGSRGTRADQGVRPTSSAAFPILRRVCGIRLTGLLRFRPQYVALIDVELPCALVSTTETEVSGAVLVPFAMVKGMVSKKLLP